MQVRDSIDWYKALAGIVSNAQSVFLYGKAFERVKATAEALRGGKLASIGTVCTTRFCSSERKVYKDFSSNLVLFIEVYLLPHKL